MTAHTKASPTILLVEDDKELALEISTHLKELGYTVVHVETMSAGVEILNSKDITLIVADRMLSGDDSLPVIESLRLKGNPYPVLILSGLASVDDRIMGLQAGGDDYLVKPFAMGELAARVAALLRRSSSMPGTSLQFGPLVMDFIERKVKRGERDIELLPREFKLLEYLMRHPGVIVTRTMLLENVWNYNFVPQTNLVDVHIGKLRHKIDGPGETPLLRRIRNQGFILEIQSLEVFQSDVGL